MSRRRLLFLVGVLTVVVLAAFALPAIANEDMMATNEPSIEQQEENTQSQIPVIDQDLQAENTAAPVSCWQYSDVFQRWEWDCD